MKSFKKGNIKKDVKPVAFSFFQPSNSSNTEYVKGYYDNKLY